MLILGGGFAGLSSALSLSAEHYDVSLIDERPHFEFLPNIHELVSGVKTPDALRLPLAAQLRLAGHRFVRDRVLAIDTEARTVRTGRRPESSFDAMIFALGGIDATRGVPGVEEHALPFKSVGQCHRIGGRLARLAARKSPGRVVIVGGGLEGVEALGEVLRRYRGSRISTTIVDAQPRLLAEAPSSLDRKIRALCAPFDVSIRTGQKVARIEAKSVVLEGGDRLASDLTIWTGGPQASPLLAEAGLAPPGAWAPVTDSLQSVGHDSIFVAGDAAALARPIAKQAYHAMDMGQHAASNLARFLAGDEPRPFRPSGKPMLVSFGDLSTFLVAGERGLASAALAPGKEAIFEVTMAQLDASPWCDRVPHAIDRAELAARALWWPTLTSPRAWLRQADLAWIGADG